MWLHHGDPAEALGLDDAWAALGRSHIHHKAIEWPRLLKEHLQQDVACRMMKYPTEGVL